MRSGVPTTMDSRNLAAPPDSPEPRSEPDAASCEVLQKLLAALGSYIDSYQGRFTPVSVALLNDITRILREAVSFASSNERQDMQLASIRTILTDYLPSSVNAYVRLPPEFALTHKNAEGNTPCDEFNLQLQLLRDSAQESATSLYSGDADRLRAQTSFLRSKFAKSELDLP